MSLTAYVRYDNTGRIVPGGPIVTSIKPKVGDWVAVDDVLTTVPNYKLRGFIRYIKNGDYVAGSLILQHNEPQDGNWKEVYVLKPAVTINPVTYYNVAGCERMEYHVIRYDSNSILQPGWVVINETPECWTIIDQTNGPEDVGNVQQVWLGYENNCTPCIDSHTTTTTSTTTTTPPYRYYNVNGYSCNPCNPIGSFTAFVPYNTPLTIGYFYNNPENRGYSFEILEERAPIVGGYDLTGEPGYALCTDACP
jgi:hypothetical protein